MKMTKEKIQTIKWAALVSIMVVGVLWLDTLRTNESDAARALSAQGLTNIQYTGFKYFGCGEDDFFHTGFTATNSQGKVVSGTVCSGIWTKDATIRW